MTTNEKAKAQEMLDAIRAGQTLFTRAGSGWMIIGPAADITVGATVTVTKRDGSTTQVVVDQLGVSGEKQGVAYQNATFREVRAERPVTTTRPARPSRIRCEHTDTDNDGICYACGAYVRGADAGLVIRRYGLYR